jgi:hypothetical protein
MGLRIWLEFHKKDQVFNKFCLTKSGELCSIIKTKRNKAMTGKSNLGNVAKRAGDGGNPV